MHLHIYMYIYKLAKPQTNNVTQLVEKQFVHHGATFFLRQFVEIDEFNFLF